VDDVFIIGGGPAGLVAAIAARRQGFRVVVSDSRHPPIDKACGEGMMPDALIAASEMGLDLRSIASASVRGVRFLGDGVKVEALFPHGPGCGIRRTSLHAFLVEQAESCGVELRWGQAICDLSRIKAQWIIGADGASSRVRQWAGLDRFSRNTWRFGFRRHFRIAPWTDHIEAYWADGLEVYVTPVAADEVGVAVLSRNPKLRVADALGLIPELKGAPAISKERGSITASRTLQRVVHSNVALIGDASGSVDAITAEGLSMCFRQAVALAAAMKKGDLNAYQQAHKKLARRPRLMAGMMLTMDRSPLIRRLALRTMAAHPRLFSELLAFHAGGPKPQIKPAAVPRTAYDIPGGTSPSPACLPDTNNSPRRS
jgi:menaquinone-9 beta-reductase